MNRGAITPHDLLAKSLGTTSSFRFEKEVAAEAAIKSDLAKVGDSKIERFAGTSSSPDMPKPAGGANAVPLRTHSAFPAFSMESAFTAATMAQHEAEQKAEDKVISAERHDELVEMFVQDMLRDKKDMEVEHEADSEAKETEHIKSLIMSMTSDNKQRVSEAAMELRKMLEEAEEHVAIKLRMKILSVPLALEKICFCITAAEEHWMVLVPTGLSIRAGPHVRKPRIGSLHFRQVVPVLSVHAAWLRIANHLAPEGFSEAWVALYDEATGRVCMQRTTEDQHKVDVVWLVQLLCESRHLSVQLCRLTGLLSSLSFLATITPHSSPIKAAAQSLLFRLRSSALLLHGGPLPPRPARDPALLTASRCTSALDVHALRTEARRRPLSPPLLPADDASQAARRPGEEASAERSRLSVGKEASRESVASSHASARTALTSATAAASSTTGTDRKSVV